ncbi:MAG: polysaccharide deacetylase family protein, partial [Clostridia bacterium]
LTGKTPKFFRPPFGDYDNKLIECIEALDMVAIQWSVDSLDWKGIQSKEIAQRVLSRVQNGSIILFHNNSDYILEALP